MSRQYFGTDGVRGRFGGEVVNPNFFARLAEAAGRWASRGTVVIGCDTRVSGKELLQGVQRGFWAAGWAVVDLGILPTPAVARQVAETGAELGVVITASHNPAADNGIKFFGPGGIKLSDKEELAIEQMLPAAPSSATGFRQELHGALAGYLTAMAGQLSADALAGWTIVTDTANGATVETTPEVLARLGAAVIRLGASPDGLNINDGVGSEYPESMAKLVVEKAAKIGIAHDGDGDRCIVCDERGSVLGGDEILTILATDALARGTLRNSVLVVTQQSNLGVDAAMRTAGGRVERTHIGDRYVAERMRATGAVLGGESSGHIICADVGPTGDGLAAALKLIEVMLATGEPLSSLRGRLKRFPQRMGTLAVTAKPPLADCPTLSAESKTLAAELGDRGRLLIRYSGTEPKLRILVEGPDDPTVEAAFDRLLRAARTDLQ